MNDVYNEAYYHSGCGPIPYEESEVWERFFGAIADRIVEDLHPKTVLDAGCAMGYLVAALRDRGVEAYGIDISDYAISKVREDIRPYCVVGSLSEPISHEVLPEKYDLITSVEVLEHLTEEDGKTAIAALCSMTDHIIFTSSPDDLTEPTHINVQQREYWARLFAENGFADDLSYRPTYLTSHAISFRRNADWSAQLMDYERFIVQSERDSVIQQENWSKAVADKEQHIRNLDAVIASKDTAITDFRSQIDYLDLQIAQLHREIGTKDAKLAETERTLAETEQELDHYKLHYQSAINQREALKIDVAFWQSQFNAVVHSASWKITKPLRAAVAVLKKILSHNKYAWLFAKGIKSLMFEGFSATLVKTRRKIGQLQHTSVPLYTPEELEEQKKVTFPKEIKFSILVPLYNTPEKYLREMIQSVQAQTYSNWELCLADGSDDEHPHVGKIVHQLAKKDPRIRYQKLEKNLGISGNTNVCIDMAQGDFISLFDHDDLLHPAALYEKMQVICQQDADFIYTDENTFHNTPADAFCPHFKPDYAPDTLRANNYICHFTSFKKSLLDTVGKFRPECDGSQDFDMVLRLTEKAEKIVHIPKILYYWRAHANSVAENVGAKPYVITAAKKAIHDHLDRVGLKGEVLDSAVPSMYRLRYEIDGTPLVSIIIPNYEHRDELKTCLDSIYAKTTYPNFEVIIVENNSSSEEIFQYYDEIQAKWSNLKVVVWDSHFNYSAINNFGARYASGAHLLLLNNDTEVISPDWIQEMLMYSQRSDVGAVGAKLYYPDDTIQHAGLGLGLLTLAGHLHRGFDRSHPGYMGRLIYAQNLSGVTAACVMIRKDIWDQLGGLDESFEVAFNDVDLCMRIRASGHLIVWTPFAELYHYESKSRGLDDTPKKKKRFISETIRFQNRWAKELAAGDPYYNPNFSLDKEDFSIR